MKKVERKQFYYRDFYRIADGRYASYWAGKFNNVFMSSGHKRTAELEVEKAFTHVKIQYRLIPLEMLLESLEKVKPTFNLNYIIVSGRKREFPVFLPAHKRLRLAVRWLKQLITARRELYLNQRVFAELNDVHTSKRHTLLKRRDELFSLAVTNRFNARYAY